MDTRFRPQDVEGDLYRRWETEGAFDVKGEGEPFVIMMPPPNVTGNLHIGHALTFSIEDTLVRFNRLLGRPTLWLPGTDHAGIGTQAVVERELRGEGRTKEDMGREAFLERVWEWRRRSGDQILVQLRRLGASPDWSRLHFTLDADLSRAVREAFVAEYEKGLIYRGPYIVNWCPSCKSALSDLEVEHREEPGVLWTIAYPLADGSGEIPVATTRPETMLGDTAVAVHPDDTRYRHLVGSKALLPILGREIPIVADPSVDRDFGTGAVKVTPAHSPEDFLTAQRHHLPKLQIIDDTGRMENVPEAYTGLTTIEARRKVLEDLRSEGYLRGEVELPHSIGHCERCDTIVEPRLSDQWFLRTEPLAKMVLAALDDGSLRIFPDRFTKTLRQWLENIRDWCISRQIWWGHRIPAWHCGKCGQITVAREDPDRFGSCGSGDIHQDEDVLDTWFSSTLWPFSTLGWPDDTHDLRAYFPTTLLETGYDILFFWVARMVMRSLELTGEIPFRDVLLHGLVRDKDGHKMSKSRGNGVDPLLAIGEYGADALRWALLTGSTPGQDIRYSEDRLIEGRNFANKIWNAARFVAGATEGMGEDAPEAEGTLDLWIRDRAAKTAAAVRDELRTYEIGEAARLAHDFFWGDFCDVYLEGVKPRLKGNDAPGVAKLLRHLLREGLTVLHPFMPFVTEAVWQELSFTEGFLTTASWPDRQEEHAEARAGVDALLDLVRATRNLKAEAGIPVRSPAHVVIRPAGGNTGILGSEAELFETLTRVSFSLSEEGPAPRGALAGRTAEADVFLPLEGHVDLQSELERVTRELAELDRNVARSEARLENPEFRGHAPEDVVAKEQTRLLAARDQRERARRRKAALEEAVR